MIVVAVNRRAGVEECAREVRRGHSRHPRAVPHRRPRDPHESPQRQKKLVSIIRQSSLCTKSAEYLPVRVKTRSRPSLPRDGASTARARPGIYSTAACASLEESGVRARAHTPAHTSRRPPWVVSAKLKFFDCNSGRAFSRNPDLRERREGWRVRDAGPLRVDRVIRNRRAWT